MKVDARTGKRLPPLSFRYKLFLAMMLVVAGVTGATFYVTQNLVQATYLRLFEQQSRSMNRLFNSMRETRLNNTQLRCLAFSSSVRLLALMNRLSSDTAKSDRKDYGETAEKLYLTSENELREVLAAPAAVRASPGAAFVRFLDANGEVVAPPLTVAAGLNQPAMRQHLAQQLSLIGKGLADVAAQSVGYLAPETENGRPRLLEVVLTRIVDSQSGNPVGALVLGFPMPFTEGETNEFQSGIWLGGQLHASSIPIPIRPGLARRLAEEMRVTRQARGDFDFRAEQGQYRVYYESLNSGSNFPQAAQIFMYSLADALRAQQALHWRILGFGSLALTAALAMSLLLSHGLSVPIRELVAGTGQIRQGNFDVKVRVRSEDEIGRLTASFNEMAVGLALKEKYRSVLNLVADKEVAQELMRGAVALGGETREVSVLFCDIRGFTGITQHMNPADVIDLLNEHMTALTRVVYEHHGVVDKFVGDLIMAVFGAPKSYGPDCENAARCAVGMIRERSKLNTISRHDISVGIGVASGKAVAGCMGSSDRLNYTVLGERVNLASRLCGKAGRMEVLVDQTTKERLGDLARVEPLVDLDLKGFSGRVLAYKLLDIASPKLSTA